MNEEGSDEFDTRVLTGSFTIVNNTNPNSYGIDVSKFLSGFYFAEVRAEGMRQVAKFVKQ